MIEIYNSDNDEDTESTERSISSKIATGKNHSSYNKSRFVMFMVNKWSRDSRLKLI